MDTISIERECQNIMNYLNNIKRQTNNLREMYDFENEEPLNKIDNNIKEATAHLEYIYYDLLRR